MSNVKRTIVPRVSKVMIDINVAPQPISATVRDKVKTLFIKAVGTIAVGNDNTVTLGGTHALMGTGDVKVFEIQPGEDELDLNKFWILGSNPASKLQVLAWD